MKVKDRSRDPGCDGSEDYIFRFALGEPPADADPVALIRTLLQEMLSIVELTDHGEVVRVDGFQLIADPSTTHAITK